MPNPLKHLLWDDFRLVKAIAEARGLPGAADRIGVNHSTVFRRLRQIEETLGVALFERRRTGYTPTAAGDEAVRLAHRMEAEVAGLTRRLAGKEIVPAGDLRVTTNDTLLVHLLTPIFAGFREAFPEIRLDIVLSNLALNLSKRDADIAIRATDNPPETLVGRKAAWLAWALYGGAQDFAEPPACFEPARYRWITLGEAMGGFKLVRYVHKQVPAEQIVYRVNTVLGLAEAVEAGIGVGFLPCFIADARSGLRRLAPLQPNFGTDLWLLTHPDLRQAPRVRALMDFLALEIGKRRKLIEGGSVPD
jgi:DNA-binding transcriptional LysR family regulator